MYQHKIALGITGHDDIKYIENRLNQTRDFGYPDMNLDNGYSSTSGYRVVYGLYLQYYIYTECPKPIVLPVKSRFLRAFGD